MADHVTPRPHPVHWSSEGSGPAVVLLHGLGGDRGFWTAETAALRGGYRVLAVDLQGNVVATVATTWPIGGARLGGTDIATKIAAASSKRGCPRRSTVSRLSHRAHRLDTD